MDKIVRTQVQKQPNISMDTIDDRKALDSVPYSWVLEVLCLYNIDASLIYDYPPDDLF